MKTSKSQITTAKHNAWLINKEHGDIEAIHTNTSISKHKIRKALDYGDCDQETADAIDAYFKERNAKVIS